MKILYVTTVSMTMDFFPEHFRMLLAKGHFVELACNCEKPVSDKIAALGLTVYNLPFSRSPLALSNIRAAKALKQLVQQGNYDIVHCHTPNAAAITRLVCRPFRKKGLKVFYTAHGFHFFKGAPLKNWLIYYPVEWLCSRWTDVLITINSEDYALAKGKFHAGKVEQIPGVGFDVARFQNTAVDRNEMRHALGIPQNAFILLSVGELNTNKNQQIILKAMAKLNNSNLHYLIVGRGDQDIVLKKLAQDLNLADKIHLLGFRSDIAELCKSADAFCFPSRREGLGLAALEAMACGLPLLTSNIHGINDYSVHGKTGFKYAADDADGFAEGIKELYVNSDLRKNISSHNQRVAEKYSNSDCIQILQKIYK